MVVRIGVSASTSVFEGRLVEEVTHAYVSSVLRAGGMPVVLPVLDADLAEPMLDGLDGLLLSGGGDVEPGRYGGVPTPEVAGVDPARDDWELALVHGALARGLPVLGVCRGAQIINVAAGGTLVPDLPAVTGLQHRERDRYNEVIHPVDIAPESRLARAMGRLHAGVNTLHHQAVDQVGLGLEAVAWGPDGVVEAVEGVAHSRVFGVQWHPELLPDQPGNPELFGWLVAEAARARSVAEVADSLRPAVPLVHGPAGGVIDAVA